MPCSPFRRCIWPMEPALWHLTMALRGSPGTCSLPNKTGGGTRNIADVRKVGDSFPDGSETDARHCERSEAISYRPHRFSANCRHRGLQQEIASSRIPRNDARPIAETVFKRFRQCLIDSRRGQILLPVFPKRGIKCRFAFQPFSFLAFS